METPIPLSKANTTFSLDLFKKLSEGDKTGNIFYSPFSITSALSMVMLGTRGITNTQMSEVLCFTEREQPSSTDGKPSVMESQMQTRKKLLLQTKQHTGLPGYLQQCLKSRGERDDVHSRFGKLLSQLYKEDATYLLSLANRLFGEQSYSFVEHFLAETKKYYNAELESVDFKNKTEEARVHINGWVEEQTQGKIKDLLVKGLLNASTRLVLVNAIYFKGNWNEQFKEEFTVDAPFRINKNDTKPVKMMWMKSKFTLISIPEAKLQILEMPYEGKDLSMLIFLPNDIEDETTGLEQLEKELTYENFVEWTRPDLAGQSEIEVRLPRFKMEEKYDLKEVLTSMGMEDAFDVTKSNFSGMSPANDLVLSEVVHKAFVEVNEEGTEAAAATAAVVVERTAVIMERFIADHPFIFFIRHNTTKSILFAGRYCSPE